EVRPAPLPKGWTATAQPGLFDEPNPIRHAVNATDNFVSDHDPADGVYAELGNMITGSGWISAGPGYRHHILGERAFIDASAAVSWNYYKVAQVRIEWPRLAHDRLSVGAQTVYQDLLQVDFFGLGNDSRNADESAYRLDNVDVIGYAGVQANRWLSVNGRVGWARQPNFSTATGRNVTVPNTIDRFTEATAPGITTQPSFLHADVSLVADTRDHAGHPTAGGLYRAGVASYSDRDGGAYSFQRYEVEGAQFIPLFRRKWVVALHGWEVFSSDDVPFYLMPSLGGQNTLRGYDDYRFHDRDMQEFNAESRWSLFSHLDAAVFADTGKVASRAGDLDLSHLKHSYGVGLRLHNATSMLARVDVGHSAEGWHVFFKMSDAFKRSTPAFGRSSVIPFVP
ncbi:MAG TPA: BamA/TamA family outer membrane protein, partial [Vicinamibacterales bacterium]|nr:BamA/TamA family outer membrane protein [Vicinamibacterales bacterium]